ncbi:MAG TPA: flagellar biosynthesis protein FlhB [Candidatus Saccharimonadales bacterium]|nr:flagellar biosynthesis protein FlhB [Candidatus Saccharimonadales bacterium]
MAEENKDEKTEPASPRKRAEARSRGQVAQSQEVNSALVLLASILALSWAAPHMARELGGLARLYWGEGIHRAWSAESAQGEVTFLLVHVGWAMAPALLLIGLTGVLSNLMQVGFVFSGAPLTPKLSNLNPIKGAQRIFSRNGLVELVKAIVKLAIITWLTWGTLRDEFLRLIPFHGSDLSQVLPAAGRATYHLALRVTLGLLLVALADYGWKRFQFEENLKMTREEVKDEAKQSEGDPRVRARMRALQRAMSRRRMMQDVPKADVVISNPTHYAVALRYRGGQMSAPVVLAKGARLLAQRIKEIARNHNVPMVEDRVLARALYQAVEVGQEIPIQFYEAVAEVLAFVYRLRARRAGVA